MKNFTKNELVNQLGATDDDVDIVMEYQKKIPILNEYYGVDGFCISARDLFHQLNPGAKTKFVDWWNRRVKSYMFEENVDFTMISRLEEIKTKGGDRRSVNYNVTVEMAKQLSMIERTEAGKICRKYFIKIEDIVKRKLNWISTREPEKKGYNDLSKALSNYTYRMTGRVADKYDFSREANTLNMIALGCKSSEVRLYFNLELNDLIRDSMYKEFNERLLKLQEWDCLCLNMNMGYVQRLEFLIKAFESTYINAKPILPHQTEEDFAKVRKSLLEKVS